MSSDEWVDDVKPTLGEKIKNIFFPKHKKSKKHIDKDVTTLTPVTVNSIDLDENKQDDLDESIIVVDSSKPVEDKVEVVPNEDDWDVRKKKIKKRVEADLNRGIPGNMLIKRGIATVLFLLYGYMLVVVVKYEVASTVVCILTLLIILDYLAITRGKNEVWEE